MTTDWDRLLDKRPVLRALPATLREVARVRRFAVEETLYRQGERPTAALYVLDGEVRLVRPSTGGGEVVVQRSRAGFIAEASLDAEGYHCDVVAAADGRLLQFPLAAFRAALDREPVFNRAWRALLAGEVRTLRARCERLSLNGAAERVMHCIETEGVDGVLTLTESRKAWAAELGLTHETLYRTLHRLQRDGVLVLDGRSIALARDG